MVLLHSRLFVVSAEEKVSLLTRVCGIGMTDARPVFRMREERATTKHGCLIIFSDPHPVLGKNPGGTEI